MLVLSSLTAFVVPARAAAVLADLENALMCKCDDKCGKVLINCTCDTSHKTRATFTKMLESGLTVEQIIQGQVDKYGESILSSPTKKGFNLTAWMTPFGALIIGGLGIRKILQTWVHKDQPHSDTIGEKAGEAGESEASRKFSSRLKDELDNIEL